MMRVVSRHIIIQKILWTFMARVVSAGARKNAVRENARRDGLSSD